MENFFQETLKILEDNNKTESDVLWVGNRYVKTTWDKFREIAKLTSTDSNISPDLLVVGDGWYLQRTSGWFENYIWAYRTFIKEPNTTIELKTITIPEYQPITNYSKMLCVINDINDI